MRLPPACPSARTKVANSRATLARLAGQRVAPAVAAGGDMLPTHSLHDTHLRHGVAWAGGSARPVVATGLMHGLSRWGGSGNAHGGGVLKKLLSAIVVAAVLLPLCFLASDRMGTGEVWPPGLDGGRRMLKPTPEDLPAAALKNLVLVAGHAVYTGVDFHEAVKESSWFLEDYQKIPGEAQSFLDHIQLGVEQASRDPSALLLFSGGQTRRAAGPRSEGLSYWVVAEAADWFNTTGVRERTFTEEHARDSFENLLFGLCRFYELTGHYPDNIVIVSYTLKQERFMTLHREAVKFPLEHFDFVGTPVPPLAKGAEEGEARTVAAFKENPYGCTGELLQKRLRRDPFAVGPIHPSRCPEMRALLTHCAPYMFEGKVPWQ